MAFNYEYPYTDPKQYNDDWLLNKMKELIKDWGEFHDNISMEWDETKNEWTLTKSAWNDLKEFVETFFENLDVQDEVNTKLNGLVADGTMSNLLAPFIQGQSAPIVVATTAAMTDQSKLYVHSPDGHMYAYRDGAWRDTGIVYGELDQLTQLSEDLTTYQNAIQAGYDYLYKKDRVIKGGGRINALTGEIVDPVTFFEYVEIPVREGDTLVFSTNSTSGGDGRGYALYDENYNYVTGQVTDGVANYSVVIPVGVAFFRIGSHKDYWTTASSNFYVYYALPNYKKYVNNNAFLNRGFYDADLNNAIESGIYYLGANCTNYPSNFTNVTNKTLFVISKTAASGNYAIQYLISNEKEIATYRRILEIDSKVVLVDWHTEYDFAELGFYNGSLNNISHSGSYHLGANCTDIPSELNSVENMTIFAIGGSALNGAFVHLYLIANDDRTWHKIIHRQGHTVLRDWKRVDTPTIDNTWNAVGDSITEQGRYMAKVSEILGIPYNNKGISSCTIAINNSYLQNSSIVERVCGLNGNTPIADADLWTVMGGLNDCLYGSPIGSLQPTGSNYDKTTVYGALQTICENILNRRANARLILFTPTQSVRDDWSVAQYPTTMALIRKAIKDVAEYYSIPCLDMWAESGVSRFNIQRSTNPTTSDGVHLNALGAELASVCIVNAIKDKFLK